MNDRADRLVRRLPELGADLVMITSLVNVRYLTGYTGSNGVVLLGPDTRTFLTDFRYVEQAAEEVGDAFDRRIVVQELIDGVIGLIGERELRLGFEDAHLTVRAHAHLRERLPASVELFGVGDPVEEMRLVKEPAEIERIVRATQLADDALASILEQGLTGRTERQVAIALTRAMVDRGAQAASFDPIAAAGPHG
ncbi:MAG: M24 family metallopeptidase, partial [Solirubrobacteraceae bacterium]